MEKDNKRDIKKLGRKKTLTVKNLGIQQKLLMKLSRQQMYMSQLGCSIRPELSHKMTKYYMEGDLKRSGRKSEIHDCWKVVKTLGSNKMLTLTKRGKEWIK